MAILWLLAIIWIILFLVTIIHDTIEKKQEKISKEAKANNYRGADFYFVIKKIKKTMHYSIIMKLHIWLFTPYILSIAH